MAREVNNAWNWVQTLFCVYDWQNEEEIKSDLPLFSSCLHYLLPGLLLKDGQAALPHLCLTSGFYFVSRKKKREEEGEADYLFKKNKKKKENWCCFQWNSDEIENEVLTFEE